MELASTLNASLENFGGLPELMRQSTRPNTWPCAGAIAGHKHAKRVLLLAPGLYSYFGLLNYSLFIATISP